MTVVMAVESSTKKVIRQDSVASIQTEGLLGNKYLEITFGSDSAPMSSNGSSDQYCAPAGYFRLCSRRRTKSWIQPNKP